MPLLPREVRTYILSIPVIVALGLPATSTAQFDLSDAIKYGKLLQTSGNPTASFPFGYSLVQRIYVAKVWLDQPVDGGIVGSIARSPDLKDIFIGFRSNRGREEDATWAQDAKFLLVPFRAVPNAGLVGDDFANLYESARAGSQNGPKVIDVLRTLVNDGQVETIHIAGLGIFATSANLLAIDMVGNSVFRNVSVYTFSSPRLGNPEFAERYNQLVPETWRFTNKFDIMTKLPAPPAFAHVGRSWSFQGGAFTINCGLSLQTYLHTLDPSEPLDTSCQPRPSGNRIWAEVSTWKQSILRHPIAATILGLLGTYMFGMAALLLLAWQKGSQVFARGWLIKTASKPLLVVPGLGRWALFLGYRRRLANSTAIRQVTDDYFGLPVDGPTGESIPADSTGESLHKAIAQSAEPQGAVIIVGLGGAGKSTLLARLALLALRNGLPAPLRGYLPVVVPANFYRSTLVKAIADSLRERDGVAITEELATAQLQSGRFLVLFDGLTEIAADDKSFCTQQILREMANYDYRLSRFILATRDASELPSNLKVYRLRPLTWDFISKSLPHYSLGTAAEGLILQQLREFGSQPISPLLFKMMLVTLTREIGNQVSHNIASLYMLYFRRLLKFESDEDGWDGWRVALEMLAHWFLIDTGKRSFGLPHSVLIDKLEGVKQDGSTGTGVMKDLERRYGFRVKEAHAFLRSAESAGILTGGRRWRFSHDTFEEYFAASRLTTIISDEDIWPDLMKWIEPAERQEDFLGVLDFASQMLSEADREVIINLGLPELWKNRIASGDNLLVTKEGKAATGKRQHPEDGKNGSPADDRHLQANLPFELGQ